LVYLKSMKKTILISLIIFIGTSITQDVAKPIRLIESIINSSQFTITIERLDFGYIMNQQIYAFNNNKSLSVTQHIRLNPEQKSTLNNTKLKSSTTKALIEYCSSIKLFELNKNNEHKTLFNTMDIHDFIYITNLKDTVLLSDVHSKAINNIRNIIENNRE